MRFLKQLITAWFSGRGRQRDVPDDRRDLETILEKLWILQLRRKRMKTFGQYQKKKAP
jgi:hypothetical protein